MLARLLADFSVKCCDLTEYIFGVLQSFSTTYLVDDLIFIAYLMLMSLTASSVSALRSDAPLGVSA